LRRASREVGAVNFFTFIVGLRSCRQVLQVNRLEQDY
jgi:hypothetical protein